jgi:hypothetical protein
VIDKKIIAQPGGPALRSRRTASRDSLFLSAIICRAGESKDEVAPSRVRNLSAIGLMADYDQVAAAGDRVTVTVRGIGSVSGKVAWVKRGRIGVTFDVEVNPLSARRPVVKPAPQQRLQRPL